jgi:hypothetical protein
VPPPTLCSAFSRTVPHLDSSRDISTGDIEARRREAGDGGLGRVLCVLFTDGGIVDGAEEDGFAGLGIQLA